MSAEVEALGGGFGFRPGEGDDADAVDLVEAPFDVLDADTGGDVKERSFHHGEALDAPVQVGDLFDEAQFGFGCGAEVGDEGVADFVIFGGYFGFEEGVFVGAEAMTNTVE